MATGSYGPFRFGDIEVGGDKKCSCGAIQNQHTLGQSARCDWLKRTPQERAALISKGEANRDMKGDKIARVARREAA